MDMADIQRTSWIAIRSGCIKLPSQFFSRSHVHTRHTHTLSLASSGGTRSSMQSSPYLQQHFYFVSEHGLNRHHVRNKRFATNSLSERVPRAISTVQERGFVESYERFAYKWFSRVRRTTDIQDIKYRMRKEMTEIGATGAGTKRGGLDGFVNSILLGTVNGDKHASSRRYKAFPSSASRLIIV